jgi:uncharacterized hydrophobic protein (TIGR00341 family)
VRVGWFARVIDAGHEYRNSLAEVEDGLFLDVGSRRAKLTKFWVQLVLASVIAAGGVISNSTPAVIGAMIIAPLATPIYGFALGAVVGDRRALRDSLLLLLGGVGVNILIGVLMAALTVQRMPLSGNPQVTGRTSSTILDLTVAVAVGIAGSFALSRRDVADILAGVAIAISLVPVLAVVGITLGAREWGMATGALVLFLTNAAAILVAGAIVFTAAGYQREATHRDARAGRRAKTLIAVLLIVLLLPLGYSSFRTLQYQRWTNRVEAATQEWVKGTPWRVGGVQVQSGEILVTAIGPGSPPPLDELARAIRRGVPRRVTVRLVEEGGAVRTL